jgi:hypothetical protein
MEAALNELPRSPPFYGTLRSCNDELVQTVIAGARAGKGTQQHPTNTQRSGEMSPITEGGATPQWYGDSLEGGQRTRFTGS